MKHTISAIVLIVYQLSIAALFDVDQPCATPQYLTLGSPGRIDCDFGESFYGAFWYNSSNYEETLPVLYYKDRKPSGIGYASGEFNISSNGSLIINQVSLGHDHEFTVVAFQTKLETKTIPHFVKVVITVRPSQEHPLFTTCDSNRFCFRELGHPTELSCYIQGSRPPVNLTLSKITLKGPAPIETTETYTRHITLYTSASSIHLSAQHPTLFQALSCEASEPPKLLVNNYSVILLQNGPIDITQTQTSTRFGERSKILELNCNDGQITYLVWKKSKPDGSVSNVAKAVFYGDGFVDTLSSKFNVVNGGRELLISNLAVEDEGTYVCVFGDGEMEGMRVIEVKVYVPPDPPYLNVDGCNPQQHCVLTATRISSRELKCSLNGIRPSVNLRWSFHDQTESDFEELSSSQKLISHDGIVYDVTIITKFRFDAVKQEKVTFECAVVGNTSIVNIMPTYVDVLIPLSEAPPTTVTPNGEPDNKASLLAVIGSLFALIVLLAVVFLLIVRRRFQTDGVDVGSTPAANEDVPLLSQSERSFKKQLVSYYREACEGIKRLPGCVNVKVDEIFVEGDLEILKSNMNKQNYWEKLDSYHEILNEHNRIILEGGTGYGKSILCLKMAHDWYTRNQASPLKNVDLFILLHMRHFQKNTSLYQAIKQYLLPKDSHFTIEDIKNMLNQANSALIVLDGFNRFPHSHEYGQTHFKEIMMKQVLRTCTVLLVTTPAILPNPLPNLTTRLRLVGFDEIAQHKYISKVVTKRDSHEGKRISNLFNNIPGIFAFCQIPLFFTLLAHLAYEKKLSKELSAETITDCFKGIINALSDDNLQYTPTAAEEQILHREAFKALRDTNKGLIWDEETLKNLLGGQLYHKYRNIGILVEDEVYEHQKYVKKVTFYHNVFCEWFAALYLADPNGSSDPETNLSKILNGIHPINYQYVYRFASGLNGDVAEEIINHLKNVKDGEAFATMCILEQKGGVAGIQDAVRDICAVPVNISNKHTRLLQRSNTQLLVLASENKIPIEIVWLNDTNAYFNRATKSLVFTSGIKLPKLETMILLSIAESGKEFSPQQFAGILDYADVCTGLKGLRFRGCILPLRIEKKCLKILRDRSISVEWVLPVADKTLYVLNPNRGTWEANGDKLSDGLYKLAKKCICEK
ncbi:uncharacterized protein [Apostichopus japonicus]|uniref:uncharacterized protein n=1 Tax=Stichopus japonicus TaxID=307972 RepID=UPI003AB51FD7